MAEGGFTINNQDRASLRLEAIGDVPLTDIQSFLEAFQNSYSALNAFESLTDTALERLEPFLSKAHSTGSSINIRDFPIGPIWGEMMLRFSSPRFDPAELVRPEQTLVLKSVRLQSPGFWEFFGKLNPLEVIRQFLNDMHERRKDRMYREGAEERKLYLQNLALENQVLKGRIAIVRSLGATDSDLTPLLNHLVINPLNRLATHQNSGLIARATIARPQSETQDAPVAART